MKLTEQELSERIARTLLEDVMDGCKSTPVGLANQILKEISEEIEKLPTPGGFETDAAAWEDCRQKILNLFNH